MEQREEEIPKMKAGERYEIKHKESGQRREVEVISRAGKATSKKWSDSYNIRDLGTGQTRWINMREYENFRIIPEEENVLLGEYNDGKIMECKLKEIENWVRNEVFEEVENQGQKTIDTRWVVTEKIKDGQVVNKARLVARGFEEYGKILETEAPTCAPETLKICIAKILQEGWAVRSLDVRAAYLQGDRITREVYIRPPEEAHTSGIWKLKKAVYGLKDAARAWYQSVLGHVRALGGLPSKLEPTIFRWLNERGRLIGVMCTHVDDFFYGGNELFTRSVIGKLKERLEVGCEEEVNFKYIGVRVNQERDRVVLSQEHYSAGVKEVEAWRFRGDRTLDMKEQSLYRSILGQLNWLVQHTRPDLAVGVSMASRKMQVAKTGDMRKLLKLVTKAKAERVEVVMERLEGGEIEMEVFSDASFGNVDGGKSQVGYMIGLTDGRGKRCPLIWKSKIARRVARSTIEAEAVSLGEALEVALYLKELWRELSVSELSITGKTDSRTLERAIVSATAVSNRRLRIDLAAMKETLESGQVERIEWIGSTQQVADGLTKVCGRESLLLEYVGGTEREEERGVRVRETRW